MAGPAFLPACGERITASCSPTDHVSISGLLILKIQLSPTPSTGRWVEREVALRSESWAHDSPRLSLGGRESRIASRLTLGSRGSRLRSQQGLGLWLCHLCSFWDPSFCSAHTFPRPHFSYGGQPRKFLTMCVLMKMSVTLGFSPGRSLAHWP